MNVSYVLLGVSVYMPFGTLVKLYFPELSATVVLLGEPLSVNRTPLPRSEGLIFPDIFPVGIAAILKLTAGTFEFLTVIVVLEGLNTYPDLLGVTIYVPLVILEKLYCPFELAVAVAFRAPLNVTKVPTPKLDGLIVPDIEAATAVLEYKEAAQSRTEPDIIVFLTIGLLVPTTFIEGPHCVGIK